MTDDDERLWKHVDHDCSRLVSLHVEINAPGWSAGSPESTRTVGKALNIAYAAAYRTVMDFAHSGRPWPPDKRSKYPVREDGRREGKLAHPRDITSKELCGGPLADGWTPEEEKRHDDSDKLVAHLSKDRVEREGDEKQKRGEEDWDWGDERDRVLWEDYVRRLVGEHGEHLPETAAALKRLDAMGQAGP
jgi:hypothetical protein